MAAFAPAAPEGAGAGCWLGVCAGCDCGASGKESSCFWPEAADCWGKGLAKSGISLAMTNAPDRTAIEKHFEYLRPIRFIYALQSL